MVRHYHRRGVDVNRLRNDLDNLLHILHYCGFIVVKLIFPIAPSFGRRFFFLWCAGEGKRTQGLPYYSLGSVWGQREAT
jgi:hypothetical protein